MHVDIEVSRCPLLAFVVLRGGIVPFRSGLRQLESFLSISRFLPLASAPARVCGPTDSLAGGLCVILLFSTIQQYAEKCSMCSVRACV